MLCLKCEQAGPLWLPRVKARAQQVCGSPSEEWLCRTASSQHRPFSQAVAQRTELSPKGSPTILGPAPRLVFQVQEAPRCARWRGGS